MNDAWNIIMRIKIFHAKLHVRSAKNKRCLLFFVSGTGHSWVIWTKSISCLGVLPLQAWSHAVKVPQCSEFEKLLLAHIKSEHVSYCNDDQVFVQSPSQPYLKTKLTLTFSLRLFDALFDAISFKVCMHDDNLQWALHLCTSFGELDLMSRSQLCWKPSR